MKYRIITPAGEVSEQFECASAGGLASDDMRRVVGCSLEFVKVLVPTTCREGELCHMVVNETGATTLERESKLPINARATTIYWNATREGRTPVEYDPLTMPLVHGVAILYDGLLP